MTLSAYFMSKSVFDVQGCRALNLALARLCLQLLPYSLAVQFCVLYAFVTCSLL